MFPSRSRPFRPNSFIIYYIIYFVFFLSYLKTRPPKNKMLLWQLCSLLLQPTEKIVLSSRSLSRLEVKPGIQILGSKWVTDTNIVCLLVSVLKYVDRITPPPFCRRDSSCGRGEELNSQRATGRADHLFCGGAAVRRVITGLDRDLWGRHPSLSVFVWTSEGQQWTGKNY